jgi:hypothetical protein
VAILPAEISGHIVAMAVLLKRGYIVRVATNRHNTRSDKEM